MYSGQSHYGKFGYKMPYLIDKNAIYRLTMGSWKCSQHSKISKSKQATYLIIVTVMVTHIVISFYYRSCPDQDPYLKLHRASYSIFMHLQPTQ